ncbi:MAG: thioredoxin [Rikenellaceae bacterium]
MSKLTIFIQPHCPHCVRALAYIEQIKREREDLAGVEIELVDELKEAARADRYDYYYVPTFYLGDEKLSEGTVTMSKVLEILERSKQQ